jgi:hypothetical protein
LRRYDAERKEKEAAKKGKDKKEKGEGKKSGGKKGSDKGPVTVSLEATEVGLYKLKAVQVESS